MCEGAATDDSSTVLIDNSPLVDLEIQRVKVSEDGIR